MSRLVLILCVSAALAGCGSGGGGGGASKSTPLLGRPGGADQAAEALGFPGFATKNTTRVGGADPVADAAAVARAVYPAVSTQTRPRVVVVVDVDDWRAAISASQLMSAPLRAPIVFSRDGKFPEASKAALAALKPSGADKAGNAQVIRIGPAAAKPEGLRSTDVAGADYATLAQAIDRLHSAAAGEPSSAVIVAPADQPAFAMAAAGLSARTGAPILWSQKDRLPPATRQVLAARREPKIYVLGPEAAISGRVEEQLGKLGAVRRVSGADPVRHAIAVARFADGRFGWNVVDPGHGLVFASSTRPADAAAAAPLSTTGSFGPLVVVAEAGALPPPLQAYLLDIQPGYDKDPVRGVYNHGWLIGDAGAISVAVQAQIDSLLEIQPVEASAG